MEIKFSKWNVFWISHLLIIKMSEGLVSTKGELIFIPAPLVPVGINLTIICINKLQTCTRRMTFLFEINIDKRIPEWQNQTTSIIQLIDIRESYHVVCYIECNRSLYVINMEQLQVGYPPDRPTNIECRLEEFSSEMKCEWNTGQTTGLPTQYEVHLKNLQTGEGAAVNTTEAVVTFPVDMTQKETHQIQIFAANQLNQSESEAVRFRLADIVIPLPPVIRKISISDRSLRIHIHWRNQTSEHQRYCQVEYKTLKLQSWALAGEQINKDNIVSLNKIRNADSLRVRCREDIGKSYWSKWSAPHLVPPSAPEDVPNVWRILGQQLPDGAREVTFLIMSDLDDSQQNNISGYEVYYYNDEIRTALKLCPSLGVQCDALIPNGVQTVFIAAYNPYGYSPATELPVQEEEGPVKSLQPTSMSVHWQHPPSPAEPLRWYALQWRSDSCDGKNTDVSWQKVEKTMSIIKDNLAPGQGVSISLYAVYSSRVSRPATVYGYTQELEPKTGPSSIKIVRSSLEARVIEWDEIPLCDRRGFITGYTVYIRQYLNESSFVYKVPASTRHLLFDKFNPDEQYSVCISASTQAGEGPAVHCTNFHQDNDFNSYVGLLVGTAFGVIVLSAIILTLSRIWKRVKIGLILLLPKCLHEEYPHTGRSSAVKSLQANKESPEPPLIVLLEDPEIVEIEELPKEETIPIMSTEASNMVEVDKMPLIPVTDIEVPEHALGYRPQIANVTSQQQDPYFSPFHMLDLQRTTLGSGSLVVPTNNTFLLNITNDMDLMVTTDFDLDEEPLQLPMLHNQWENQTFIDRLIISEDPGDPISTPSLNGEFDDTKSYFPQIFTEGL
ncbi:interleukin-23 receptor isoform X2 [Dendropsophus ebraccatus]|uniref:interleukin-23 receptor isoform X2 n=1 Tax=Dendropsophus ebraccatus TaxID=150705 RepID=UPI0038316C70